jgi:IPT/TIG domain
MTYPDMSRDYAGYFGTPPRFPVYAIDTDSNFGVTIRLASQGLQRNDELLAEVAEAVAHFLMDRRAEPTLILPGGPAWVSIERITPDTGRTGYTTIVIIDGRRAGSVTADRPPTFGGIPATNVVRRNVDQVQVTAPAQVPPGPCDVSFTIDEGIATLHGGFTYLIPGE